jgi:UBA/TS-N domain
MGRSDDVTLASLAHTALAACGGNPEAAAEYILVQVINDKRLLRSIFLPTIKETQ